MKNKNASGLVQVFANVSDLLRKVSGFNVYAQLHNGYCIPVKKSDLKLISKSMISNGNEFTGIISFTPNQKSVQVKIY